jgi:hypothetical protein
VGVHHWHGKPSELLTAGSNPRRTTGGVFHFVATNKTDVGGTMTEAEFFGAFSAAFRYGASTKVGVRVAAGGGRGERVPAREARDDPVGQRQDLRAVVMQLRSRTGR